MSLVINIETCSGDIDRDVVSVAHFSWLHAIDCMPASHVSVYPHAVVVNIQSNIWASINIGKLVTGSSNQ